MLHEFLIGSLLLSIPVFPRYLRKVFQIAVPSIVLASVLAFGDYETVLIGTGGIRLGLDRGSRYFMVSGALVYLGVALSRLKKDLNHVDHFLFLSSFITLELSFMSKDLFNLYVMMEILSVQAGLMILKEKDSGSLWSALKYLLIGGAGANLYLLGVGMVYASNGTFDMKSVTDISPISASLMIVGLLIRGGVFAFGMWLPQFHSKAPSDVSALLSGAFVNSVVYTVYRMSDAPAFGSYLSVLEIVSPILVLGGALLSLSKSKPKEILASSSMAHIGMMFSNPGASPIYALAHSIVKAPMFLLHGSGKSFDRLIYAISSLSLLGFPMTYGGYAENILVRDTNFLSKLIAMVSVSMVGVSIFRSFPRYDEKGFSLHSTFFLGVLISLSVFYRSFDFVGSVPVIVALVLRFILGEKRLFKSFEKLERLENNLVSAVLGLVVMMIWVSRL